MPTSTVSLPTRTALSRQFDPETGSQTTEYTLVNFS
jgi:hypothetical protein